MSILRNAAIPGLAVRHLKLYTCKGMPNPASDAGLQMLDPANNVLSRAPFQHARTEVAPVLTLFSFIIGLEFLALFHPDIVGIAVDLLRLRRYQFSRTADVMLVGGAVDRIRDDADEGVSGNVHLHTEMPRISIFAARHFRIPLVIAILC